MPKKAVTYYLCHHLPPLYRFNLSAAVKGNILPRPCRGVTVHCCWWLPWIQTKDSDERMLTVCVAVRRRARRIRSEGRQNCFIDHIHKTAVFLRVGSFNAGMLCSFFQVESHINTGNLTNSSNLTASQLIGNWKDDGQWKSGGTMGHISSLNNIFDNPLTLALNLFH